MSAQTKVYDGNYLSVIVEHNDGTETVTDHASYAVIDRDGNFCIIFALKPDSVSADYTVKVSAPNNGIVFHNSVFRTQTKAKGNYKIFKR
ncbi:MAG: hypothetical protein L6V93_08330 [Clostridiales bacterium]|nr:MAG: hypothetical protein L6V93_08330 [Clostridiales bacterium]